MERKTKSHACATYGPKFCGDFSNGFPPNGSNITGVVGNEKMAIDLSNRYGR